jgi:membrane-associated protein
LNQIQEFFQLVLNSEEIIRVGGLALVTAIVFAETGLFFCFFFPGDYLLFSAGILCGSVTNGHAVLDVPLWQLQTCIVSAAILGNLTGYLFGRYLGHTFDTMKESFFFKREYITNTQKSFMKYGGRALIVGRFLPVIRTFAPILAGITRFPFPTFLLYNVLGGVAWVGLLTTTGFYLGQQFPGIVNYIEYIIIAFVAFTSIVLFRSMQQLRKEAAAEKLVQQERADREAKEAEKVSSEDRNI